ncbi:MAG: CPBP family glutamic-type intramembrane protease [Pseudomonadota bacterium]
MATKYVQSTAVVAAVVCGAAPLLYAIQYGVGARIRWSGAMLFGYFAIVACFIPVLIAVGKLLYAACRRALLAFFERSSLTELVQSAYGPQLGSPQPGSVVTVVAGVTLTQAVAQFGRWFVLTAPPQSDLLSTPNAILQVLVTHVLLAAVVESAILALALELARRWLDGRLLIVVASAAFGLLHGVKEPFWFFPAAVLFAYCTAVYLSEVRAARRGRALWLISATHVLNNAVGFALIIGREIILGGAS